MWLSWCAADSSSLLFHLKSIRIKKRSKFQSDAKLFLRWQIETSISFHLLEAKRIIYQSTGVREKRERELMCYFQYLGSATNPSLVLSNKFWLPENWRRNAAHKNELSKRVKVLNDIDFYCSNLSYILLLFSVPFKEVKDASTWDTTNVDISSIY